MAYENTSVTTDKSQAEIRGLLRDHGATRFTFGESTDLEGVRWAGIEFEHAGHMVRMVAPMKPPDEKWVRDKVRRARTKTRQDIENEAYEQEERRIWRVIRWSLKSRMVAIDEGLETFQQAFLAHLVDPSSDRTVWQTVKPQVEAGVFKIGGPGLPAISAPVPDEGEVVVDAEIID